MKQRRKSTINAVFAERRYRCPAVLAVRDDTNGGTGRVPSVNSEIWWSSCWRRKCWRLRSNVSLSRPKCCVTRSPTSGPVYCPLARDSSIALCATSRPTSSAFNASSSGPRFMLTVAGQAYMSALLGAPPLLLLMMWQACAPDMSTSAPRETAIGPFCAAYAAPKSNRRGARCLKRVADGFCRKCRWD